MTERDVIARNNQGDKMSVRIRVERIQNEIEGVASQYGVTSWEREFLDSVAIPAKTRRTP